MPDTPPRGSSRGVTSPMRYDDFMRAFLPDNSTPAVHSSANEPAMSPVNRRDDQRATDANGDSFEADDMPELVEGESEVGEPEEREQASLPLARNCTCYFHIDLLFSRLI